MNLVKVIPVCMPSHHIIKHGAEKASVTVGFTFCTTGQCPRYVTENLHSINNMTDTSLL